MADAQTIMSDAAAPIDTNGWAKTLPPQKPTQRARQGTSVSFELRCTYYCRRGIRKKANSAIVTSSHPGWQTVKGPDWSGYRTAEAAEADSLVRLLPVPVD